MSISTTELEIKRGDSKSYTLYFKDENNVAIDITGYTVFFTVKLELDDSDDDAVIQKTITVHSSPTEGVTVIELSPTDTNLTGNYIFDIQIKNVSAEIQTIMEGNISFSKDVTQRTE